MRRFEESMNQIDNANFIEPGILHSVTCMNVEQGDPIYVAHNVVDMIDYAMESFEPEIVMPSDPFAPAGFAYLSKGLMVKDVNGLRAPIRAIGWMPTRIDDDIDGEVGVWVTFWAHADDDELSDYKRVGTNLRNAHPNAVLTVVHSFFMPYNSRAWLDTSEAAIEAAMTQWKVTQVLWRLGSQLVRTNEKASRGARRDAARYHNAHDEITLITLRKSSERAHEASGEEANYSCSFIVRGHWRKQWYPSIEAHRQKWINPYVKGDLDMPLKMTKRVFEFVR